MPKVLSRVKAVGLYLPLTTFISKKRSATSLYLPQRTNTNIRAYPIGYALMLCMLWGLLIDLYLGSGSLALVA